MTYYFCITSAYGELEYKMKKCLPFLDLDLDTVIVFKDLLSHTNISFKNAIIIYLFFFFPFKLVLQKEKKERNYLYLVMWKFHSWPQRIISLFLDWPWLFIVCLKYGGDKDMLQKILFLNNAISIKKISLNISHETAWPVGQVGGKGSKP